MNDLYGKFYPMNTPTDNTWNLGTLTFTEEQKKVYNISSSYYPIGKLSRLRITAVIDIKYNFPNPFFVEIDIRLPTTGKYFLPTPILSSLSNSTYIIGNKNGNETSVFKDTFGFTTEQKIIDFSFVTMRVE